MDVKIWLLEALHFWKKVTQSQVWPIWRVGGYLVTLEQLLFTTVHVQNSTKFTAKQLIPKTFEKISWHESIDTPTS